MGERRVLTRRRATAALHNFPASSRARQASSASTRSLSSLGFSAWLRLSSTCVSDGLTVAFWIYH